MRLSHSLLRGHNQAVCWDRRLIYSLSWGTALLPRSLLWLLVGFGSSGTVGRRASHFHWLCLKPLPPGPYHGQLASWWLAFLRASEQIKESKQKTQSFCNPILGVIFHHSCSRPFIRSGLVCPAHVQGGRLHIGVSMNIQPF